ncbi:MAG TPA: Coagulation factor 5/8 type domain-containing protein [Solirubrobacteraceae bacterium]|nr:Coagulation factor 5/8 type domain-containing protein [Solirubrobacteraceae bacterium]
MGFRWIRRADRASVLRRGVPVIVVLAAVSLVVGGLAASTGARRLTMRQVLAAQTQLTRYSLVDGCYALRAPAGAGIAADDGPFRMQAAALGTYLLYTPKDHYLNDVGGGTLQPVATPSTASEWQVNGGGTTGFTLVNLATGTSLPVVFAASNGCSTYPEAGVDATGASFTGASPEAEVLGTVEGHSHITASELFGGDWHCGRPWSPFGAPYALPASCAADEQGTNGVLEAFLDFGGVARPRGFHGWPTFVGWPSPTALAEEGDYYTGIERAWKAGLRVMVTNLVDNEALCSIMTTRSHPCNDMDSVAIQSKDLYDLQNYIDAQSGGPGKGWFRIVTNPFQARQVINEGKLAVIEGIEVSALFNCTERGNVPSCSDAQIDSGLQQVEAMGVRTFFPVHEFNNAFGGTKGIAGTTGAIVNAGNELETGSFWNMVSCPAADQDAEQTTVPLTGVLANLLNGPLAQLTHGAPLPVYASGPTCNTDGITPYGTYLINQMIKQHLIIQLDHMDSRTAAAALGLATAAHYAGVVSAHCCNSPQLFKQVYADGGVITEPAAPAASFIGTMRNDLSQADPRFHTGFGYGSDMNGLAEQPGPSSGTPITYPFKSYVGNVTFTQEQWGQRTFNLNTDGLANYGMYADWLNDIQRLGGSTIMNAMFQGAEAYLEMWERASGVPDETCSRAGTNFSAAGLGRTLRLGDSAEQALYRAGQPLSRPGRSYRYCVSGAGASVASVFDAGGRVALIASTARGDAASGLAPGMSARRLAPRARKLAPGLWGARTGPFVYGVRGGRIAFVAVVGAGELRDVSTLRSDLAAARVL